MPDTTFDPAEFEEALQTEEAMSTRYPTVPEGDYEAIIESYKLREVSTKQGTSVVLDLNWHIPDEALQDELGMAKIVVRQGIFLDIDYVDGRPILLGTTGKNIKLGRIREALGMNKAGKMFEFSQLEGQGPLLIRVTTRSDKEDPDIIYNGVGRVSAIG